MRILFRAPNWLGDAVVSRILLHNLKNHQVTVICKDNLKEIFYDFPRVTFKNKRELFTASFKLRKEKFDIGIVAPLSFSSSFFMYISHPKEIIGFSFDKRDIFLTKKFKIPLDWKKKHTILTQFLLLKPLGIVPQIPEVYFKPLCNSPLSFSLPNRFFAIAPFAAFGSAKEWFFENYTELSRRLFEIYKLPTVMLGSKKDISRVINEKLPEYIISLVGKTNIMEAACIIKKSIIFIGNDSGLSHLSASMGHPTISIFGPTSPIWTKPLGRYSYVLWAPTKCAPCFKRECPFETKECMQNITPFKVLNKINEILKYVNNKSLKNKE